MATVLRPPLAFPPLQKRPIAAVDYFSRPLTLGINPNAQVETLDQSAPERRRSVQVDGYPNLLLSTLGTPVNAYVLPLAAEQVDDSSTRRRAAVGVDQYANLLTTTLGAPANTYLLPLAAEQIDEATTRRRAALGIDVYANLLATTLQPYTIPVPLPLSAEQLSDSAPRIKGQVRFDDLPNLQLSTLAQAPASLALPLLAVRLDASAPWPKAQVRIDQPLHRRVWADAVPKVQALDASAPQVRKILAPDVWPTLYLQRPQIARWFESAPSRLKPVPPDVLPNLTISTLFTPPPPVLNPETDTRRMLVVSLNGRTLAAGDLDGVLAAKISGNALAPDGIDAAIVVGTQSRTIH